VGRQCCHELVAAMATTGVLHSERGLLENGHAGTLAATGC
jgi:hypothetical protein